MLGDLAPLVYPTGWGVAYSYATLLPTAAGSFTEWFPAVLGTNWQEVEDASDATYVETVSGGTRDLYTFSNIPANAVTVTTVTMDIRCGNGLSNSDKYRFFWSEGGFSAQSYDYIIPGPTTTQSFGVTHPSGGSWTPTTLNNCEFGMVLVSSDPSSISLRVMRVSVEVRYTTASGRMFLPGGSLSGMGSAGVMGWDPMS